MSSKLQTALVKTLAYAAVFDYPQTMSEIRKNLISYKLPKISWEKTLVSEIKSIPQVKEYKSFYYLTGGKSIVDKRLKKEAVSRKKLILAKKYARLLFFLPFVLLVGISGNVAIENAALDDDIDLFLITSKNRIFISRFLAVFLLKVTGVYRRPDQKQVRDKICLNMLLDTDHLQLPSSERDLYSAHEIIQLKPLFQRGNVYQNFLKKNSWINDFLPNWQSQQQPLKSENTVSFKFAGLFLDALEFVLGTLQLIYMKKRKTTEVIKKGYLRFHPHDARSFIIPSFRKILVNFTA